MHRCNHPNIVHLIAQEEDATLYYLCTELCADSVETWVLRREPGLRTQVSSLSSQVADPVEAGVDARIELCRSMLEGVQAFHNAGFVHGNVTPSNFVMGNDGVPRLCGFSSATVLNHAAQATKFHTMNGTLGYMPSEILRGRKLHMVVEVTNPVAVDVFALGVTVCFVMAGALPFRGDVAMASEGHGSTVERNVQTGSHGLDAIDGLAPEVKHICSLMLSVGPQARPPIQYVLKHPMFWSLAERVKYLGSAVGAALPVRVSRSEHPVIAELEAVADRELGAYNEQDPASGGSWARLLDTRYPLTLDWGKQQRPPADEEHHYYVYGAPPSKKQVAAREKQVAAGKLTGTHAAKEIRMVGLLKFIRNVSVHSDQMIQMGRFEGEDELQRYLIQPFPWLLIAVFNADAKHNFTGDATADLTSKLERKAPTGNEKQEASELRHVSDHSQQMANPVAAVTESAGQDLVTPSMEPVGSVTAL
jgi:hypothetical protein